MYIFSPISGLAVELMVDLVHTWGQVQDGEMVRVCWGSGSGGSVVVRFAVHLRSGSGGNVVVGFAVHLWSGWGIVGEQSQVYSWSGRIIVRVVCCWWAKFDNQIKRIR